MTTYDNAIIAAAEAIVALGHQADNIRITIGAGCPVKSELADLRAIENIIERIGQKHPAILEIADAKRTDALDFDDLYPEAAFEMTHSERADAEADYDHHLQQHSLVLAAKSILRCPSDDDSKVSLEDINGVYREIEHQRRMSLVDLDEVRSLANAAADRTSENHSLIADASSQIGRILNLVEAYRKTDLAQAEVVETLSELVKAHTMSLEDLTERMFNLEKFQKEAKVAIIAMAVALNNMAEKLDVDGFDFRRN